MYFCKWAKWLVMNAWLAQASRLLGLWQMEQVLHPVLEKMGGEYIERNGLNFSFRHDTRWVNEWAPYTKEYLCSDICLLLFKEKFRRDKWYNLKCSNQEGQKWES